MNNFVVRTITGVLFVATIVVCFLSPIAMAFAFALITGMTTWEFVGLVNERDKVNVNRFITTVTSVYLFLAMMAYNSGLAASSIFIPYLVSVVYLLVAELYLKQDDPINDWAYTMMTQLYIALPFSMLNVLAFQSTADGIHYTYILPLSVFVFLWISDSGAYCCGSLIGKHKLFPRISPGKTWEGSIGGATFVVAAACAIYWLTSNYCAGEIGLNCLQWIGLGLTVTVFGTWGDLVESLFKRTLGIKDSGKVLPGHGGMLDRFDSSLLAIPASAIYLYTISLF